MEKTRRPWFPSWLWAGAAVVLLLAFFTARNTRRLRRELIAEETRWAEEERRARALEAEQKQYRRLLAVLSSPATRAWRLEPAANSKASPGRLWAYWNDQEGLILTGQHVPPPDDNRTFQLWVLTKTGRRVSGGTFRPDPNGQVLAFSRPAAHAAEAAALSITEEPSGGLPQPSPKSLWMSPP